MVQSLLFGLETGVRPPAAQIRREERRGEERALLGAGTFGHVMKRHQQWSGKVFLFTRQRSLGVCIVFGRPRSRVCRDREQDSTSGPARKGEAMHQRGLSG